jgi:putative Holliday junction resolvase
MRPGVRIGCDVGSVRIGLARSDATGLLAVPLAALPAGAESIAACAAACVEWDAIEVVVGLPLHLSGEEGASAATARAWARGVSERTGLPVRLMDERLSTVQAQRGLRATGRTTRESRSFIDSASAVIVLQAALDAERAVGTPPGEVIDTEEAT